MLDWKPFEGWNSIPVGVPLIVYLSKMELCSRVHAAIRMDNQSKTALVAGHFYFDMPEPLYWAEVPNLPEGITHG